MRPRKRILLICEDEDLRGELILVMNTRLHVEIVQSDAEPDAIVRIENRTEVCRVHSPPYLIHSGRDRADFLQNVKLILARKRGPKPRVRDTVIPVSPETFVATD